MDFFYEHFIVIAFGIVIAMGLIILFLVKRQEKEESKSKKR